MPVSAIFPHYLYVIFQERFEIIQMKYKYGGLHSVSLHEGRSRAHWQTRTAGVHRDGFREGEGGKGNKKGREVGHVHVV